MERSFALLLCVLMIAWNERTSRIVTFTNGIVSLRIRTLHLFFLYFTLTNTSIEPFFISFSQENNEKYFRSVYIRNAEANQTLLFRVFFARVKLLLHISLN